VGGPDADLCGERVVEVERRDGGVAQIEDQVVGFRQLRTEMPHGGRLADPRIGGEDAHAGVGDQLPEGAVELREAGALVEEGLPLGILGGADGR
jgi:hypothetical protein